MFLAAAVVLGAALCAPAEDRADDLAKARGLLLAGKYDEAAEVYTRLHDAQPVAATLGLARAKASAGQVSEAAELLAAAVRDHPQSADLHAERARLAFDAGDYATADVAATAALASAPEHLAARLVAADLSAARGRIKEADAGYRWFVDYYNAHDVTDAEQLVAIGRGAAQFARWNRLSDQFGFLVNELYPEALRRDPAYWPAHYEAGLLYLEKYNQAEAARELQAALVLNPAAAEVHGAVARLALQNYELDKARRSLERALAIHPRLLAAHLCRGDVELANFDTAAALATFEEACRLNPRSAAAAGRRAAAYGILDGLSNPPPEARLSREIAAAIAENEHCGEFFAALAGALDLSRRYPAAARYYQQAIDRMPQLVEPHGALGMLHMRLGDEVEAKRVLDAAFAIDPFNVRVNNTLKVLEVLDGYAVTETEHFVIKFDRGRDEILARYAARFLEEEVYPDLCRRFGYEAAGKSLFEIFQRARNTSGHGWFSARMAGLPYVSTVGACAGKVVALASPNDTPKKFNWARVLRHEFVHVLNLQQSDFNVPHWFTEALAVGSEGAARPQVWNELLAQRVPAGELFDLDTINLGFVRPNSSLDWQMAYCQADQYAQYLTARFGPQALAKLLAAYGARQDTRTALRREFGVEQEEFERGYREHLAQLVARLGMPAARKAESFAELLRAQQAAPDDAALAARLAAAYVARKEYAQARPLAERALADPAASQQAAYVLARVRLVIGETDAALALSEKHLDRDNPDRDLLALLAALRLKGGHFDSAAELYGLGAARHPADTQWAKSLARVYLAAGNDAKLAEVLSVLADRDPDDLPTRKKLAQLKLAAGDFAGAAHWARQAMHVDVMDVDLHRMCGEALAAGGQQAAAADEWSVAVELDPRDVDSQLALAEACLAANRHQRARQAIDAVMALSPENTQARQLREKLPK